MQETHDFLMTGHPGKNTLYAILARKFYWLNIAINVQQFTQNYDFYSINTVWHKHKHDLLKFLSILNQKWHEIFMDFIIQLFELINCKNIMIIINYLKKDFIIVFVK